ncbi:MFS transporter [Microbulbifer variabilis]|uniref:MFS transporter n=1 Tax=Microbulbifer variabilis TaxID=266805 RepID=A0ABY4VG94_9GAMM|nr:MFS transporter [Microbulbifer variabilis]USD22416.1 MFS transporter [Microbulbifer variabilis]
MSAPPTHIDPFDKIKIGLVLLLAMALPMFILYATGVLSPYLIKALQVQESDLSYIVMVSFGLASILSLFAGNAVDYFGLRASYVLHFITIAISFFIISISDSLWTIIGAISIVGLSQALANPLTNKLIALRIPDSSKAMMVGMKQSGVQLSALLAGFTLPFIANNWGWRVSFLAVVPIAIVMAILSWKVSPNKPLVRKSSQQYIPNRKLALLMLTQGGIGAVLSAYITYIPSFAISLSLSPEQAGLLITLFGITGMSSRIIMTPIASSFDNQAMFIVGMIGFAILAIFITMKSNIEASWPIYIGVIGIGLSIVATNAIAMGMVVKDSRFGPIAYASGMISAAFFAGIAVGSSIFGMIISFFESFSSGWIFTILILLISGSSCLILANQHSLTQQEAV